MQSGNVQHCSAVVPNAAPSQMRTHCPLHLHQLTWPPTVFIYHACQKTWLIEQTVSSDPGVGTIDNTCHLRVYVTLFVALRACKHAGAHVTCLNIFRHVL